MTTLGPAAEPRVTALRHLGILGHSAEGAALCFVECARLAMARLGEHWHPDITLDCISMSEAMPFYDADDYPPIRAILTRTLERLAAVGAEFFVCPDNTAHRALEVAGDPLPLPGLHIGQVVADEATRIGATKVAVLGTTYTMNGPIYPREFAAHGIGSSVPCAEDRDLVNRIIFDELVHGRVTDKSRSEYLRIIKDLASDGCDAVALVCTEIPLLVTPDVSPLPTLDSTRLLARAAVDVATGARLLPTWRGGPVD